MAVATPAPDSGLDQAARDKLARICSRLASDFDGERAAAAKLATAFLHARGLRWPDVVGCTPRHDDAGDDWREVVRRCSARADALTAWERGFLRDLAGFMELSPKQRALLARIAAKVGA